MRSGERARRPAPFTGRLLLLLCLSGLPGCLTLPDERVQQFTEDGISLYQGGDYAHAREYFELALQLQPADANLMFNVAQCYDRLGSADRAKEYYQLCLGRSANHARCRHALALLQFRTGHAADADRMIQEWLASEPELPDALVEDGWRLRQEGELEQAMGRFQQALYRDPQHVRGLTELGQMYEHFRQPERALDLYERALRRDPRQAELVSRVRTLKANKVGKPRPDH